MLKLTEGFKFTKGDSIHISRREPYPHLTGMLNGKTIHIKYFGQTTLGMFDRSLPGHRLGELKILHKEFSSIFKDSKLKW